MGGTQSKQAAQGQAGRVAVTLKRSMIGTPEGHRLVLRALRLRRIRQTVVLPDTPQTRGMIHKVSYLLEVRNQ